MLTYKSGLFVIVIKSRLPVLARQLIMRLSTSFADMPQIYRRAYYALSHVGRLFISCGTL